MLKPPKEWIHLRQVGLLFYRLQQTFFGFIMVYRHLPHQRRLNGEASWTMDDGPLTSHRSEIERAKEREQRPDSMLKQLAPFHWHGLPWGSAAPWQAVVSRLASCHCFDGKSLEIMDEPCWSIIIKSVITLFQTDSFLDSQSWVSKLFFLRWFCPVF